MVKWNQTFSTPRSVTGGGPQGGTAGILEYLSQTKGNLDFLEDDEAYKFIDDAGFIEVLNFITIGLSSHNSKFQIPSDMSVDDHFISSENLMTQQHLDSLSEWTDSHEMRLNCDKTKYMIFNFCHSAQFHTRIHLNNTLLDQVKETRLLGVTISDDLTWHSNTNKLVTRAYQRMLILRNLYTFNVSTQDMITIYILFIRSVVEQSCLVFINHCRGKTIFRTNTEMRTPYSI